ncbi:alpha-N-acetylgalactosaminide alpha-2,6-sialyltransferase 2-like [Protopterus annectens]|uniref:alpha-N-acetylgalactosaminide alpha-2,6-sialyltransferase 2-like n=1 Tax=Protopterus annectens TaxID=7888 RepID=UPI001CFAF527|nr:alpha-N-acetylgalactosaminide alpha-2,6-sialyltransferase 2-like [Protopterus annectens]
MIYLRRRISLKCMLLGVCCLSLLLGLNTNLLNDVHSKTQKWTKAYHRFYTGKYEPRPINTVKSVLEESLNAYAVKEHSAMANVAPEIQAMKHADVSKHASTITALIRLATQNLKRKENKQNSSRMNNETLVTTQQKVTVNTIKTKAGNVAKTSEKTIVVPTTFYLGESYEEDKTYLETKCSNGIRKRIASSPLRSKFLDKIPVLLWKKHLSKENYERLKKNYEPFGWQFTSYEVLNKSLGLLNTPANAYMFDDWETQHSRSNSSCIRCAVIGNGGILRNSSKGAEIDSHDYVFRVNGAIIKGFEQDVGKRTSFYIFSTNTMMNSLAAYRIEGFESIPHSQETRYIFLPDHDRDYIMITAALTLSENEQNKLDDSPTHFGKNLKPEIFKMLHPDFTRYVRNRFLRSYILNADSQTIYRPSTGAMALLTAIHTCDEVSAYGFITKDYQKYSDHYYDNTYKKVIFYSNHDLQMEMKLWETLHENKIIKLYMRS